jgi:hypothetical protein
MNIPNRLERAKEPGATPDLSERRRLLAFSLFSLGSMQVLGACSGSDPSEVESVSAANPQGPTNPGAVTPPPAAAPSPPAPPPPAVGPAPAPPAPVPPAPTAPVPPAVVPTEAPPLGTAPPLTDALPAWVPGAGQVAVLSTANGRLTNRFVDVVAPYYEGFYSAKNINDYSTTVVNEHWGRYGALISFGGGHSSSNDNSVIALEIGESACTFKRLTNPSPLFGAATDGATRYKNSTAVQVARDTTYGEYAVDGQPAAPHSYGALDIVGPSEGGAINGSLVTVVRCAVGYHGALDVLAAHRIDFPSTGGQPGSYVWQRITNETGRTDRQPNAWTAFVPAQRRIYIETRSATASQPPRWFDLTARRYMGGSGAPRRNDGSTADTGILLHVPERNLLVFADNSGGFVRLQYLDLAAADPGWAGVTMGAAVPATPLWACACWCPDNQRLLLGDVRDDSRCVYEVHIPTQVSSPWGCTRAPLPAGQSIDWPSNPEPGSAVYKKWSYNRKVRAILFFPSARHTGDEVVFAYRPRGT